VRDSQADRTRLDHLFPGATPVPLEEGLHRTVEWFRCNGVTDATRAAPVTWPGRRHTSMGDRG
jgi:hypothetical protein